VIAIANLSYLFTWCRYFGTTSIGMAGYGTKSYMGSILESRSKTSGDVRVP
jgi:hypothetical protein